MTLKQAEQNLRDAYAAQKISFTLLIIGLNNIGLADQFGVESEEQYHE